MMVLETLSGLVSRDVPLVSTHCVCALYCNCNLMDNYKIIEFHPRQPEKSRHRIK